MEENTENKDNKDNNNNIIIIMLGIVAVVLIAIVVLLFLMLQDEESAGTTPEPTATATVIPATLPPDVIVPEPTLEPAPTVVIPTPEPGVPTGRVIAPDGVNLRSGPGTNYPVVGTAPFDATGKLAGISEDGQWYAAILQPAPLQLGWVSARLIAVTNGENLPVLPTPPTPTPTATPTPAATPTSTITFTADSYTLNAGVCTTLRWSSANVQAVYVYPQGDNYLNFGVPGTGTQQVCPTSTTTYEMRVVMSDGSTQILQVTITVNQSNPLANTSWTVAELIGNPPIAGTSMSTTFNADNSLSAFGGCNTFSAQYTITGDVISITPLTGTQIACSDAINTQEAAFTSALQSANKFEINNNQLIIRDPAGREVLRYNRS